MFPGPDNCYARSYTADHLAEHPSQRVTDIRLSPDVQIVGPSLVLHVELRLRGTPGGAVEGYGYCETEGKDAVACTMEGDAGAFVVTPAKDGAVLVTVSDLGISFETDSGFVTLKRSSGDDRSFMLRPVACR